MPQVIKITKNNKNKDAAEQKLNNKKKYKINLNYIMKMLFLVYIEACVIHYFGTLELL